MDTARAVNDIDGEERILDSVLSVEQKAAAFRDGDSHSVSPNAARKKENGLMVLFE